MCKPSFNFAIDISNGALFYSCMYRVDGEEYTVTIATTKVMPDSVTIKSALRFFCNHMILSV